MPTPAVTFAFMLATLLGAAFHLIVGGDLRRLALYLLAAWLGFSLGQLAGVLLEITLLKVGVLRLLPAVSGAAILMLAAHFLIGRPISIRR